MRTIKQYLEAAKARKENGEEGFSLVELIIVVVILGILAAVAIPIFNGIQQRAEEGAADAAAANAASMAAVALTKSPAEEIPVTSGGYAISYNPGTPTTVDQICATATKGDITSKPNGPGCAASGADADSE